MLSTLVRSHLRPASPESIREANAQKQPHEPHFLPVEEELRRLAAEGSKCISERGELLANHPDEIVPLAAIRIARERLEPFASAALTRALRDADLAGEAWTPLLDALASSRVWPVFSSDEMRKKWWNDSSPPLPSLRINQLAVHISEQTDPENLNCLLNCEYDGVHMAVAEHATILSENQVRLFLKSRALTQILVGNSTAAKSHAGIIAEKLLAQLHEGTPWQKTETKECLETLAKYTELPESIFKKLTNIATKREQGSWLAKQLLMEIAATPERIIRRLWSESAPRKYSNNSEHLQMLFHPNVSTAFWEWALEESSSLLHPIAIVEHGQIDEERQLLLYQHYSDNKALLERLIKLPNASLPLLRQIARQHSNPTVRIQLAEVPAARRDPEISSILASSQLSQVAWSLASDTETHGPAFVKAYGKIMDEDPVQAREILEIRMRHNPCPVPPEWISPFLSSPDSELRELAITWLAHAEPLPPPKAKSSAARSENRHSRGRQLPPG